MTENLEMKKLLVSVLDHCNRLTLKFSYITQTELGEQKNALIFVDTEVT